MIWFIFFCIIALLVCLLPAAMVVIDACRRADIEADKKYLAMCKDGIVDMIDSPRDIRRGAK